MLFKKVLKFDLTADYDLGSFRSFREVARQFGIRNWGVIVLMKIGLDGGSCRILGFWIRTIPGRPNLGNVDWIHRKSREITWTWIVSQSQKSRVPGRPALIGVGRIQWIFRDITKTGNVSQSQKSSIPGQHPGQVVERAYCVISRSRVLPPSCLA